MISKKRVGGWLLLLAAIGAGAITADAYTFIESFTTTSYKDAAATSAVWDTSGSGQVILPSTYAFSQPGGLVNWGGQIRAIHYNGSEWLVGGVGAKLNSYNGTAWTNLAPELNGFANNQINAIWHHDGVWMIGGSGKKLNFYSSGAFSDRSGDLASWTSQDINAIRYGGGTESYWLIAGYGGRLNRYNGTTFTNLAGSAGFFATTTVAYALGYNSTFNYWLIGGDGGSLSRYQSGTFTDLSPALRASAFGTNTVRAIDSDGTRWLIGGSGGKLVSYNGSTFTDLSSSVPAFINVFSIHYNGSFWILVGNGSGSAPVVYTWDGSTWRNQSANLSGFGSTNPIYSVYYGNSMFLLGGNQARINSRTGGASSTSYTDLSAEPKDLGYKDINAIAADSSGAVLVGGNDGALNQYNGTAFTDLSSQLSGAGWAGAHVLAICGNGTDWLIGGASGKLVRYNGSTTTDLTSLLGFTGSVTAIHWNGTEWLIGGTDRQLVRYNGASTFTALDLSAISPAFSSTETVKAIRAGGGMWMIGGDAGHLAIYDEYGTLSGLLSGGFTAINAIGYASVSGSDLFMVGGVYSPQQVRIYDKVGGWQSWVSLSGFGTDAVLCLDYCPPFNYWYIGGANAKLNIYQLGEAGDVSTELVNYSTSSINGLAWNGTYWLLGGSQGRVNKYSPTYEQPKWAQSTVVESVAFGSFTYLTLTAAEDLPAGTTINYWVTANGQLADPHSYWVQATPGALVDLSGVNAGPQIKWKAELATGDPGESPKINQITLDYLVPATPTFTYTSTATPTPTPTRTPTASPTSTITKTSTISPTITPTSTITPTATEVIFSPTITPTSTPTGTYTHTPTVTPTVTVTSTITLTSTITPTSTETPFYSPTQTPTVTVTPSWTPSPTPTPNPLLPFLPGTLIIPMDAQSGRTNQNYAMFRAYGLIYRLLLDGIPVYWSIVNHATPPYKLYEENDFTCSQTTDLIGNTFVSYSGTKYSKGTNYLNVSYSGGPFLIAPANSTAAMAIINEWNNRYAESNRNQAVMVHQYTGTGEFSANIYRKLRAAPKIAVFQTGQGSPYGEIVTYGYLNNARIVNNTAGQKWWSSTYQWSSSAPDTFTNAELAGTGSGGVGGVEGDHQDGALFFTGHGLPKYSIFVSGHWDGHYTGSGGTLLPADAEVIAEVETFLKYPSVHFFAQCIAVNTFENGLLDKSPVVYGGHAHFLSTGGLSYYGSTINYTSNMIAHYPVAQAIGRWGPSLTGAQTAYGYQSGSLPWGGDSTAVHIWTTGWVTPQPTPAATPASSISNMYMSNWAWGNNAYGKISYLCTHQCNTSSYPYTSNTSGVGGRYFFNCMFESPAVSLNVPEMSLTLNAPGQAEIGENATYTVSYQNLSGIAYNVVLTLPDPANTTYLSCTGGGLHGAGSVTWNLGTLDIGAGASVNVTYRMNDSGGAGWDGQAEVVYYSGQTQFDALSNSVHTEQVVYTPTPTTTPSVTSTRTATRTWTPTSSATPSATQTLTSTHTPTFTETPTDTVTPTITETSTISPTPTESPVYSPTNTPTETPTYTVTPTDTPTPSVTPTSTWTPTWTPTRTPTWTPTSTWTPTGTPSFTDTPTELPTATFTATMTITPSPTISVTVIPTLTVTPTATPTPVATPERIDVFPNPFRPDSATGHVLKFDNIPPESDIRIFSISGELIRRYGDASGRQTWDGKNAGGEDVVAGVYIYLVKMPDGKTKTGKIFLLR